jgi:hypothetical protein
MSDCCIPGQNGLNPAVAQGSDCCAVPAPNGAHASVTPVANCPVCGTRGKAVDTQTLKAMLTVSLEAVRPIAYRFCRDENCPIAYFSTDGQQTFLETDLRERVHQKHLMDDDVFVCYCFRHTPGTIRAELMETGASTVVQQISAGIKAGQCACELRNPQGDCCLGNVTATVKRVTANLIFFVSLRANDE